MLEWIKKKIYAIYGNTMKSYYIISIADFIQVGLCLLFIAYVFNLWYFVVIGSLIMYVLSNYSYHFHCKSLDNCTIITSILFYIFGFIASQSPIWLAFLLCIFMIKEMYLKMPLKIIDKTKSEEWHNKRFLLCIIVFLIVSIILNYFNLILLCSSVLWSIIMYGLLFFINEKSYI